MQNNKANCPYQGKHEMVKPKDLIPRIGSFFVISGSLLAIAGTLVNNLMLDHIPAMEIWLISNPLLTLWAIGYWRKWWTDGIDALALVAMYMTFFISGAIGLFYGGI
jgi:hypothetical protein